MGRGVGREWLMIEGTDVKRSDVGYPFRPATDENSYCKITLSRSG